MRRRLASWLRRAQTWIGRRADRLDPPVPTAADRLMPLARNYCLQVNSAVRAGSIKHLVVMKQLEKHTKASRWDINEAIERAAREIRSGAVGPVAYGD